MYLPVNTQPDCVSAWLAAVKAVQAKSGNEAYNVIIDIENPASNLNPSHPVIQIMDEFMREKSKSVHCVANTIFPIAIYQKYGAPEFFKAFNENVLPKVRKSQQWSGYYFERMTSQIGADGSDINPLWEIVRRMASETNRSNNKYELATYDVTRDSNNSVYGGQCLSFLSFKLLKGEAKKRLALTAMYRNHYYIEKLLGNLIGLGRLMQFIAHEADLEVGPMTIISTHATIDQMGRPSADIQALIAQCEKAAAEALKEAA